MHAASVLSYTRSPAARAQSCIPCSLSGKMLGNCIHTLKRASGYRHSMRVTADGGAGHFVKVRRTSALRASRTWDDAVS